MRPLYLEHFGLARAPFDLAPQRDYFFAGLAMKRALDALRHIIVHEPSLAVVTGEVGVGKTTLAKVLLADLPEEAAVVFLDNPTFSRDEILQALAEACGIAIDSGHRQALAALKQAAIARRQGDRPLVILIDEAHLMRPESVEEVRLLTNLEHEGARLFGIILMGQPELRDGLLARHDLRQVRDRVKYWIDLPPMPVEEVGVYLDHRLRVAGWKGGQVFPPKVARVIWRASAGRPRRINLIADRCLLAAYLDDATSVREAHLQRALTDIEDGRALARPTAAFSRFARPWLLALAVATIVAAGALFWLFSVEWGGLGQTILDAGPMAATPPAAPVGQAVAPPVREQADVGLKLDTLLRDTP